MYALGRQILSDQLSDKGNKHDPWKRLTWDLTRWPSQLLHNWWHFLGHWGSQCMLSWKREGGDGLVGFDWQVFSWWADVKMESRLELQRGSLATACFYSAMGSHSSQTQTFKSSRRCWSKRCEWVMEDFARVIVSQVENRCRAVKSCWVCQLGWEETKALLHFSAIFGH